MRTRVIVGVLTLVALGVTAVPVHAGTEDAPETVWICHPDVADNPCLSDLTATVVRADGTTEVEETPPARNPKIDCFYAYPTVSGQQTTNADLSIDPEIAAIAQLQASRFSEVCRVFAPVYRQVTIAGLFAGGDRAAAFATAYGDVVAAWDEYLRTQNDGRGVVLIGHSQGAGMLEMLYADEIEDTRKVRRRIVSALLIGSDVTARRGEDSGGAFDRLAACRAPEQMGCVVAYSSFDTVPPQNTLFGTPAGPGGTQADPDLEVLCTNPAELSGDGDALVAYFRTDRFPGVFGAVGNPPSADTPWVQYPDLYTAACASDERASWLQVDAVDAAGDDRPRVAAGIGAEWGLHLVDVQVAYGNLVDLVRAQAREYLAAS